MGDSGGNVRRSKRESVSARSTAAAAVDTTGKEAESSTPAQQRRSQRASSKVKTIVEDSESVELDTKKKTTSRSKRRVASVSLPSTDANAHVETDSTSLSRSSRRPTRTFSTKEPKILNRFTADTATALCEVIYSHLRENCMQCNVFQDTTSPGAFSSIWVILDTNRGL